jgi:16S rRNA (guanine966-N2)-methyltransferase
MRIVAGRHRGRILKSPRGRATRPTAARAREGLFNILAHGGFGTDGGSVLDGARVLEAFAGTGAFTFEALSRGAASATLLDLNEDALEAARTNAKALGEREAAHVLRMDAVRPRTAEAAHDLVFLDPPYGLKLGAKALMALAAKGWIAPGALVIIEVGAKEDFAPPAGFGVIEERRFGAARFVLMRFEGTADAA